ncbi:hypothetical protein GIB67_027897 [Kingdonia uniflora]|uniref:Tr-type G domain-containing protein n=1 Tax=Kingdonia uniflora TaxID=39325 RepID=A0A7J7LGP9_9MAGN|nr:hypothetical protein GIB67_027897 [Kingdonia uniflora]
MVSSEEVEESEKIESVGVDKVEFEDNSESVNGVDENFHIVEEDADEDWDAKSWDGDAINLHVRDDNHGCEVIDKSKTTETYFQKNDGNLRSPIVCVMGHVDSGKTKLLDCIRGTNIQEGEAGGHEQFGNLRSRGSGLCDIAILLVDIVHGLKPQTIESLNLLKTRKTEFIIALIKVDRLYGWKTCPNAPIVKAMQQQSKDVHNEFKMGLTQIVTEFKEQGLNTELYYKNKEMGQTFSIIPTSAISGEGIPDLLLLLAHWTQKTMPDKLTFSNEVKCTVLEVKHIEGLGTTIDVILVNGVLREKDQIVVCGENGPIVTTIRSLHTPHPMKELRIKGSYQDYKELKAAQGIRIIAQGVEQAIVGSDLYVVGPEDNLERIKASVTQGKDCSYSQVAKISSYFLDGVLRTSTFKFLGGQSSNSSMVEFSVANCPILRHCSYSQVGQDFFLNGQLTISSTLKFLDGQVGTPICIPSQDFINIGRIASIEINHNPVNEATKGNEVGIKITSTNFVDQQSKFGRHAKIGDELVSHITRESIDVLKAHYKTEISSAEWRLVQKLMKIFKIRSNLLSV